MEVSYLGKNSLKIRSKIATLVVNPDVSTPKTEADAVISLSSTEPDVSKITDFRVILSGSGEYEVNGIKITSVKNESGLVYRLSIDRVDVVLATANAISKMTNALPAHVVVIDADSVPSDKNITAMQPNVVIFYGEKAAEAAKAIKEGTFTPVNKYVTTFEKLPEEMEVVVLG